MNCPPLFASAELPAFSFVTEIRVRLKLSGRSPEGEHDPCDDFELERHSQAFRGWEQLLFPPEKVGDALTSAAAGSSGVIPSRCSMHGGLRDQDTDRLIRRTNICATWSEMTVPGSIPFKTFAIRRLRQAVFIARYGIHISALKGGQRFCDQIFRLEQGKILAR